MKKGIKGIRLMCLLLVGAFVANAHIQQFSIASFKRRATICQ